LLADFRLGGDVGLCLQGLLGTLLCGTLLLGGVDGRLTSSGSSFGSLVSSLLDHIEGGTDDSSLRLNGTAGALLGNFLRDTLLVLSSEENGPGNATGVLALKEKGLGFAVLESEDLAVTTDVELALSRVDLLTGEGIVVSTHID